jgi:predicted PhzF superfamily epimerase YddE/YHI9
MGIPYFHVDAFTGEGLLGNPAAVCPLDAWLPDEELQRRAAEHNLSETAYFVREGDGYRLRWFTPTVEVDLCGHATVATAHVLFQHLAHGGDRIEFLSKSGTLMVDREGELLVLDFPSRPPSRCELPIELREALPIPPLECWKARDYMVTYANRDDVAALQPDFAWMTKLAAVGIIATAPGRGEDFVSRFFAPRSGILEDPVTGSAHCTLVPHWAGLLGKSKLHARQISPRGGEVFCELRGDRVRLGGRARTYLRGEII